MTTEHESTPGLAHEGYAEDRARAAREAELRERLEEEEEDAEYCPDCGELLEDCICDEDDEDEED